MTMAVSETSDLTIQCPKCRAKIKLTEAMAAPLLDRAQAQFAQDLGEARRKIREEEGIAARRALEQESAQQAKVLKEANDRIVALSGRMAEKDAKLAEAQREQARLLAKERELDDKTRELELTIAKQVRAALVVERQAVETSVRSELELKMAEKDEQLRSLGGQIEELKRRAEQGDNRIQGEAQEVVLESLLRAKFPFDAITPVAKGVHGGDCLHVVLGTSGRAAGSILWESKRTKNWEDRWLPKLRDDMRAAKALAAVLVTQALPKGVETFGLMEGVWVVRFDLAIPVAVMMRIYIMELAVIETNAAGQATKAEMMYKYLTGPVFRGRMQAVVERFTEMADDLRKERAAITRGWAKREAQIQQSVESIAGFVGEVQAIGGKEAGEIEGLNLQSGAGLNLQLGTGGTGT